IVVDGGADWQIKGALSGGPDTISLGPNAEASVPGTGNPSDTIDFNGPGQVNVSPGYQGTVGGFEQGDKIDVIGVSADNVTVSSNKITLLKGSVEVDEVHLGAPLSAPAAAAVDLTPDGQGGVDISFGNPTTSSNDKELSGLISQAAGKISEAAGVASFILDGFGLRNTLEFIASQSFLHFLDSQVEEGKLAAGTASGAEGVLGLSIATLNLVLDS